MEKKECQCQINPDWKEVSVCNYRVPGGSLFTYELNENYVTIRSLNGNVPIYHNVSGYYCYVGDLIYVPNKRWKQMINNNQLFILEGETKEILTYSIF